MSSFTAEPTGEVGIEIAPATSPTNTKLAERLDTLLRRTCKIARALIEAEQAALKLCLGDDQARARKYFSMSEKYSAYSNFRVDPKGIGLHGMIIPAGQIVRLTQQEVLEHPLFRNFDTTTKEHPPMRGWLATSIFGADSHHYGLLQLSDKTDGRDFDEHDEESIREFAALIGDALDWLRADIVAADDDVGNARP